jgi:hypothetical protein
MHYNYISKSYLLEALRGFLQFFTIFLLIVIPIFTKQENPWSISIFQDAPLCIYSFVGKKVLKNNNNLLIFTPCVTPSAMSITGIGPNLALLCMGPLFW